MKDDVHISSVFVDAPFEAVWAWIADPLRFPTVYPNWTSKVTRSDAERYEGVAPNGDRFAIVPKLDREHGVVDFEVHNANGSVELSRARVYPLKAGGCAVVHLAYRWEGVTDGFWEEFKVGTDEDLERAKELAERHGAGRGPDQEAPSSGEERESGVVCRVVVDHVTLGVADLPTSRRFYEAALAPLGFVPAFESDEDVAFGAEGAESFWIAASGEPASGVHVAFAAPTRAAVDAFHAAALSAGGEDNGTPGERPEYGEGYYAAYVIDPDGNNTEAVCHRAEASG